MRTHAKALLARRVSTVLVQPLWLQAVVVFVLLLSSSGAGAPPIAFVQANADVPQTPQTTVTVRYEGWQTVGDLNVIVVGWNDSTAQVLSVSDTSGNAYVKAVGPTIQPDIATQSIYYAAGIISAPPGANTVTVQFTTAARYPDIRIAEYIGIDPVNPIDGVAAAFGAGDSSDSGPVATTKANVLLVGANLVQTHTTDPGTDYTSRIYTYPDGDIIEDRVVTATGSYSADAPLAGEEGWIMQLVAFRAVTSASTTAQITYPANDAVNADLLQPIQWTAVPSAQAYCLYIGSTPGAADFVNTGEIQQTWYRASTLPSGMALYARLWTKVGNVWRYSDSTFSAAPIMSVLTYPPNGATNADLATQPIQWSAVVAAQVYSLYVGSTPGASDLLTTGEVQQTSFNGGTLRSGQTLYARLWTKAGGVWRNTDSTFTVAPVSSVLTYPANGGSNVDLSKTIQWTNVVAAQAYCLYLGTSLGAKDLFNTNEVQQTWYRVFTIPSGPLLYARVWTKVGGVWRYTDSTFTAAPMTYSISGTVRPSDGGGGATIALSGSAGRSTTADSAGNYGFAGLAPGTYTVTPANSGRVLTPASWTGTVTNGDVPEVNFTGEAPTRDRANSYDNDWKRAWVNHARALLTTTGKTAGFVLEIGDSITHSGAFGLWPLQGRGKTPEDVQATSWANGTVWGNGTVDSAIKNGWYLAAADTTALRGMTAANGLRMSTLVSGCCNMGPTMPAVTDPVAARQTVGDPTYTANLQVDTLISAFGDAQFAVVMLGTNDPGSASVLVDLTTIIDRLEAQHIVPILSTIPPRADPYNNLLVIQFNRLLTQLARARSLPLIAFHEELLLRRPGNAWMNTLISSDGVHPSASSGGYAADSDPYRPGGDPVTRTTGDALLNVGYLLRSWVTVQKLQEMKLYVIDGVDPPR